MLKNHTNTRQIMNDFIELMDSEESRIEHGYIVAAMSRSNRRSVAKRNVERRVEAIAHIIGTSYNDNGERDIIFTVVEHKDMVLSFVREITDEDRTALKNLGAGKQYLGGRKVFNDRFCHRSFRIDGNIYKRAMNEWHAMMDANHPVAI